VALALGVGLLAGCGPGDPEPTGSGSLTAGSPTPTAVETTPTELVTAVPLPVMPPEMANNDAAGAEAALRYFFELYGYAYLSRDLGRWEEISSDDCLFCAAVTEEITQMLNDGETQVGGLVTVDNIESATYDSTFDVHTIDLTATQLPYKEIGPSGDVMGESDGGTFRLSAILKLTSSGWLVLEAGSSE